MTNKRKALAGEFFKMAFASPIIFTIWASSWEVSVDRSTVGAVVIAVVGLVLAFFFDFALSVPPGVVPDEVAIVRVRYESTSSTYLVLSFSHSLH